MGGRCYYAPVLLFFLAVLVLPPFNRLLPLWIMAIFAVGLLTGVEYRSPYVDWRVALAEAQERHESRVRIWPEGWYVPIPSPQEPR